MLERLIEKKAGWQGKKKKGVRNGFEVVCHVSRLLLSDLPIWANNTLTWSPAELGYSRRRECSSQKIGKNYTASSTKNEFLQLQRLCTYFCSICKILRDERLQNNYINSNQTLDVSFDGVKFDNPSGWS